MDFNSIANKIKETFTSAADTLSEKGKNAAKTNKLRSVMKQQEEAAAKEYISLGRYYYSTLRDKENAVTEPHCQRIDEIETVLNGAIDDLEQHYQELAEKKAAEAEEIDIADVVELEEAPELEELELPEGSAGTGAAATALDVATDVLGEAAVAVTKLAKKAGRAVKSGAKKAGKAAKDIAVSIESSEVDIEDAIDADSGLEAASEEFENKVVIETQNIANGAVDDIADGESKRKLKKELREEKKAAREAAKKAISAEVKKESNSNTTAADTSENDDLPFEG